MILGVGTDIVTVDRIRRALQKPAFVKKCFTENESYETPQSAAGLFAAKEAAAKALGTGFSGFFPRDIEILKDENGKPCVNLLNAAKDTVTVQVSISHERDYAVAFAIAETAQASVLPKRPKRSNKGDFGNVGVFAGSEQMTGAAALAARAALRAGAGIVRVFCDETTAAVIRLSLPEAIVNFGEYEKLTVAVIGCGMGDTEQTKTRVYEILGKLTCPVVVDADALNVISRSPEMLINYPHGKVITPHPGEASRLLGVPISEILADTVKYAKELSEKFNAVVCLKDANTVIFAPDGRFTLNKTGSPALSKAGAGDVLAGTLAAFIAQYPKELDIYDMAVKAVYVHGKAGEAAELVYGERGVLATDVADRLGLF
ncbi:hypothetical protein FACS189490_03680 [Clostridia bacterium]|nr:hypothetical protein FACS189490_03640 [Clostridia bacterium]GHV39678.1 hypothetical protein FACS189490_03680 [Clostridia bacterium]